MSEQQAITIWIGTKTQADDPEKGIYRTRLDLSTGELLEPERTAELTAPGFLTVTPSGTELYSMYKSESGGGGVAGFHVSDQDELSIINKQNTGAGKPSHVSVDREGTCVYSAQYSAGTIASFPIREDGGLQPAVERIEHSGSGPNKDRQQSAHPHWTGVDPSNRYLFVPDLGTDEVVVYRRGDVCGLERHRSISVEPGSGPRHMTFHEEAPYAYVIQELSMTVTVYRFDREEGDLEAVQTVSVLDEEDHKRPSKASEIRIHPDGSFLYTGNRGHDSISVFRIDPEDGRLTFVEREPIRGGWPRNFHVDPTGRWLVAAGQETNTLTTFEIDPEHGHLTFTGHAVNAPEPICIDFQPVETGG